MEQNFESIDDLFDKQYETTKRTLKSSFIGTGVGLAAGIAGGIYLGESINEYVALLKQAPAALQYAVNATTAVVCGGVGAVIGGAAAQLPGMYRLNRER